MNAASIVNAQIGDRAQDLRLIGKWAGQLFAMDRPIECTLALPGVQSFLELPPDKRLELEQVFVELESCMLESYSAYQERLTLLKQTLKAEIRQELDEKQRDHLAVLLDRTELAAPLVNHEGELAQSKYRFGFSWEKSQRQGKSSSLIDLTGGRAIPTSTQWIPSHISASKAIDMARRVWRRPLTCCLNLECPVWFKELDLSNGQIESLNAVLPQFGQLYSASYIESNLNGFSRMPLKQQRLVAQEVEVMLKRNQAYRAWAQQHLTAVQLNKITSLIIENFEQNCPSANGWCLTGQLIPLSPLQQAAIEDLVAGYVEQETELWEAHVERCRQQIDQTSQLASERLDHVEAAQYRRLLQDLSLYRTTGMLPPLKN